ncbi:MAG: outer membrane beta-barrel protein [Gemmatimonadota bacterium]
MRRSTRHRLAVLTIATLAGLDLAAQDSLPADTTRPAPAAADEQPKVKVSGYASTAYTVSTRFKPLPDASRQIVGRFYDRFHDQLTFNAVSVTVELPVATSRRSAGFKAQVIAGQNAALLHSSGLSFGDQGDIPQAFVTLNIPLEGGDDHWMQIKVGKMWTLMGVEVLDDPANPNVSVGNQFIYLENLTNEALGLDFRFGSALDVELRLMNGWDVVQETNRGKSVVARLGVTPSEKVGLGFLGFYGPEQAGTTGSKRYGGQFVGTFKLAAPTTLYVQADYGTESHLLANDATAAWWGIGAWLTQDLGAGFTLALRADYTDDQHGVRTSGVLGYPSAPGRRIGSTTATLNVKAWRGALVRPELRYDFSNRKDYGAPANPGKDQFTVALGVAHVM